MKLNKLVLTSALALSLVGAGAVSAQTLDQFFEVDGVYYEDADATVVYNGPLDPWVRDTTIPNETLIRYDDTLTAEQSYTAEEGQEGSVTLSTAYYVEGGRVREGDTDEIDRVEPINRVEVRGTYVAPVEENYENPEGTEGTTDEETRGTPVDVDDTIDGVTIHALQQGDYEVSGYVPLTSGLTHVRLEKNGQIIGEGAVDADGFFRVVLKYGLEYGNDIDIYGVNEDGNETVASFGEAHVGLVAPNQDPTPVIVEHATTNEVDGQSNVISGKTRPFDNVVIKIFNNAGTRQLDEVIIQADANGDWSYQSSTLVRSGNRVEVFSIDSAGNVSETINLKVDDTSRLASPDVRRAYTGDNAITIQSEPYATVTITIGDDTYTTVADANGVARLPLARPLNRGDVFTVYTQIRQQAWGSTTYTVTRGEDDVNPKQPTIDTVAEGQTLLTGTAEPFTLIQSLWTNWNDDGSFVSNTLYALADERGNWFIDLLERGLAPFEEGQRILVRSYDNAGNRSDDLVKTVVDATEAVATTAPIVVSPTGDDYDLADPNIGGEIIVDEDGNSENVEQPGNNPIDGEDDKDDKDKDDKDKDKDHGHKKDKKRGHKPAAGTSGSTASGSKAELPETGESSQYAIYGAAALSILAGLGLVAPKFKKEN